jgi:hypothetical protein
VSSQDEKSWMSAPPPGAEADGAEWALPQIDTTVPHSARRYDYWLGGKDNFAADRESGDAIAAAFPSVRIAVIENRRFVRRATDFLARHAGIQQFLDIGTGIPTSPNVHEVAQGIAPESRVVYVDNDPIVLAHARALLARSAEGATAYIDADVRDPDKIIGNPELREIFDFPRPVGTVFRQERGRVRPVLRRLRTGPAGGSRPWPNGGPGPNPSSGRPPPRPTPTARSPA